MLTDVWATVCKTVCPIPSDRCLSCLSVLSVCNVGWMDQDETWHAGRPRPWPHWVRWGPSSPSPKGAQPPPQFSAHTWYGQMAGWIKMPLGMELGFGPGDFVSDGDPAPLTQKGGGAPPHFLVHVYCGQTAGWIKIALGTEVGLGPGHIVLDGDPAPPSQKGRTAATNFRPISIVAKRLDASRCHLV